LDAPPVPDGVQVGQQRRRLNVGCVVLSGFDDRQLRVDPPLGVDERVVGGQGAGGDGA
jgi:hypothetical protein